MTTHRKYKNTEVSLAGHSFASKLEATLFQHLKLRERAGEIKDLKCQDSVFLTDARILYKPDFVATCTKTNKKIWFESKGFETDLWRIKRRLWQHYGPGTLEVYKGKASRLYLHETITPKG